MNELVGKRIGQYEVTAEIGRGGMAIVYRAVHPALGRTVAIKVLPAQFTFDEVFVQRFQREAVAAACLKHPNIVTIHDVGQEGDWVLLWSTAGVLGRGVNREQDSTIPVAKADISEDRDNDDEEVQ